ncbi:unnamed protein product, partial [Polarella glacialis]
LDGEDVAQQREDMEVLADPSSTRRRRGAFFATALFNTRTRRKYPVPDGAGWCPGDELALCHFTDAVLDGKVPPHIRSKSRVPVVSSAPPGALELIGSTLSVELLGLVAQGQAEVLLLLYAPWCSHSLNFLPLWHSLAASIAAAGATPGGKSERGVLRLAQMNAARNEHPELPPVKQFPTLLLCLPANRSGVDTSQGGEPVRFVLYTGAATIAAMLSWIAEHAATSPPLLGVEGLR